MNQQIRHSIQRHSRPDHARRGRGMGKRGLPAGLGRINEDWQAIDSSRQKRVQDRSEGGALIRTERPYGQFPKRLMTVR